MAEHAFLGIHAVNVYVRDQDRALRFYLDQLAFNLAFDAKLQTGDRWVAVSPPDGSAVLSLVAPAEGAWERRLIGRVTGIVFVTEDVVAKYNEWRKRGVDFQFTPRLRRVSYVQPEKPPSEAQSPVWGGVFTRFKDIDGNWFSLVGFDEVNREIEAQRRRAAEKLEAERRAARELEIAKEVQARLFPQTLPPIESLEYAGTCLQARQVGGDYHDFLDLGHGHFGFVVADISGKGMPAALLMANLQANLRSQCACAVEDPARFLTSVNKLFYESTNANAYATLFFAGYNHSTRSLRYANCGHLPGLIVPQEGGVTRLESTSTVLGLFKEWECPIAERRLAPGDTLALYTDGITESFSVAAEEFGESRLVETLRAKRQRPAAEIVSSIVERVQRFSSGEQQDDITVIVAKCRE